MQRMQQKRAGFTLIELMVVVAIIGILATMGLFAYQRSIKQSRDATRIADMKAYQSAFEAYYSANGSYPTTLNFTGASNYFQTGSVPTNPGGIGGSSGAYSIDASATRYCICAGLEINPSRSGNASADAASTCPYTSAASSKNYYCVSNLQ